MTNDLTELSRIVAEIATGLRQLDERVQSLEKRSHSHFRSSPRPVPHSNHKIIENKTAPTMSGRVVEGGKTDAETR